MKTSPPPVLSTYFASANEGRIDDAAACFAADALVHDEKQDHRGREAIRKWIETTTLQFSPRVEVNHLGSIDGKEGAFAARGMVSGTFPGSPIPLNYTFTVRDGKISSLDIR